jgi:acetate kinase
MDALVFTAGIGENSPEVRAAACAGLEFLGVQLDPAKNASSRGDEEISVSASRVRVMVLKAQEDWAIAKECWKLLWQDQTAGAGLRART